VVSEQTDIAKPPPRPRTTRKRTTKAAVDTTPTAEVTAVAEEPVQETAAPVETEPQAQVAVDVVERPAEPEPAQVTPPAVEPVAPRPQPERPPVGDRPRGGPQQGRSENPNGVADQPRQQDHPRGDQRGGYRGRHQRDRGDRDRGSELIVQRDGSMLSVAELDAKAINELQDIARDLNVPSFQRYRKIDLIGKILQAQSEAQGYKYGEGVLDIIEDGFGFLRGERYLPGSDDIYVSQSQIRRFGLRTGDKISGQIRPPKDNEKFHSLLRVEAVNGVDPEVARRRPNFDSLTPIFPLELIDLETQPHVISTRLLNLVAPIGRGQRGLIVSPPKAGKTLILKAIANGITTNYEDIHLMVCLIGERPEEVTDMKRSVDGEVVSSTFDEPVEDHTKVAEMVLERSKRLVEGGRDVVILLDSITRLARAYNLAVPPSGRTLSGGIDPIALYPPKRFFGAARNIEGGGSLTIVATCLVDTGSRMDDVIYEEFKGTGNMELHLDRKLAERRIYPAIDIQRSGTRREDLLLEENALRQVYTMRRMVSMLGGTEGTELVLARLAKTQSNVEFLITLNKDM
jgi:transcription termination factor Rho